MHIPRWLAMLASLCPIACAGTSSPPAADLANGEAASATGSWPEQFGALIGGAQFELATAPSRSSELVVNGTASLVSATEIRIAWKHDGADNDDNLPSRIVLADGQVVVDSISFPLHKTKTDRGGAVVFGNELEPDGPLLCYADMPELDTVCDDVCMATLCVHSNKGIVYLDGNWGPEQRQATHKDCVGPSHLIQCE